MSPSRGNVKLATTRTLEQWIQAALRSLGGSATIVDVSKEIWKEHESDLRSSGDLFYTWQYDMRWAALVLRKNNTIKDAASSPQGVWELL
jgi:hypothetical protein